jgi:hypothetical protein
LNWDPYLFMLRYFITNTVCGIPKPISLLHPDVVRITGVVAGALSLGIDTGIQSGTMTPLNFSSGRVTFSEAGLASVSRDLVSWSWT